ncbi:sensor histidine kinase [Actinomadura sp. NAK00032]|uniref:sensor histidine kinase n=1 Tax=Actinomadura sp. NAK00032 TaxID=2742128 RepID=UPI00158FF64D|nr:sensor histidine kinase [Actinomadura sp. NAK00032]QKW37841.1 sensor histidine kinase [Actinomadura sp. NAK00032]
MAGDETGNARGLLRAVLRDGILAAAVTGRAEPAPPLDRPWPAGLRWTRFLGIGRLPYGLVLNLFWLFVTFLMANGTASMLREPMRTEQAGYPGDGTVLLIAVLVTAPLALRDRHPLAAWRMSFAATMLLALSPWPPDIAYTEGGAFAALMCVYTVTVRCSRDVALGVALLSFAGVWIKDPETAPGASVLLLLPLTVGYAVRVRRTSRRELAEQERRHRDAEAVLTERQRIARELHDVVAHHMSMIAIQAEAAPYKVTDVPDETRRDLAEIRATALDALTELRRILGVLRAEDGAETAPQPGLDRLGELVGNARGAGLRVETRLAGDLAGLPPGVGLSAYRIMQEALSNAMRHAPGSRVDIEVSRDDGLVWLGVVNGPPAAGQLPGTPLPGGGHGLAGMRERAAALGGELTARPTAEGGFAVTATLPLKARETT